MKNPNKSEFEYHWQNNEQPSSSISKLNQAKCFLAPLANFLTPPSQGTLLDGIHVNLINTLLPKWHKIGIDIAHNALAISKKKDTTKSWSFIEASIDQICLSDNYVDAIICYGVLAYTRNPEHSFKELCRILKPGGIIALWIYPKPKGIAAFLFHFTRWLCKTSGQQITNLIANALVPFVGFLPTTSNISLRNASWKACKEVILVNIAPTTLHFYEKNIVLKWFQENHIEIIDDDHSQPLSLYGKKLSTSSI